MLENSGSEYQADFILEICVTCQKKMRKGPYLETGISREVLTFSSLSPAECASSHLGFAAGDFTPKVRMKVEAAP